MRYCKILIPLLAACLPTNASGQDTYGYRSEFLSEFPIARGMIEAQVGASLQNQLRLPQLGDGWRAQQEWNAAHPLFAIPEVPNSPFEGASIDANARAIAEMASQNRYVAWTKVAIWLLQADRFDYKRNPLTKNPMTGKDFGNFNAGAMAEIMDVPRTWFDFLADRVQNFQNAKYWVRGKGSFSDIFEGDETRGREYVQLGREWVVANSYRSFLSWQPEVQTKPELWPKTVIPALPPPSQADDFGLRHERPYAPDPDWWYQEPSEAPERPPEQPGPPELPPGGQTGPTIVPWL